MYKNKAVICWTCEISSFHLIKRQQLCLHQFYAVSWAVLKPTIFTSLNVLAYRVKLDSIHRQIWRPRLNIIKKNSRANFCFVCFKHSDYLKNFEYPTSSINFQWNFSLQIYIYICLVKFFFTSLCSNRPLLKNHLHTNFDSFYFFLNLIFVQLAARHLASAVLEPLSVGHTGPPSMTHYPHLHPHH